MQNRMHFPERELKPYGEPVTPDQLRIGETYFGVYFLDKDAFVPVLEPRVFIGHNLEPEDIKTSCTFKTSRVTGTGSDTILRLLRMKQFLKLAPRNTSSSTNELWTCY